MSLDEIEAEYVAAHAAGRGRGAAALRRPLDLERRRRAGAAAGGARHPLHADPGRAGLRGGGGGARARADHPRGGAEPGADPGLRPGLGDARRARRWRPSAATGATLAIHLAVHALPRVVAELAPLYGEDCPVAVVARASWPEERVVRATLGTIEAALAGRPDRPDGDHPRRARARRRGLPRQRALRRRLPAALPRAGRAVSAAAAGGGGAAGAGVAGLRAGPRLAGRRRARAASAV